MTVSEVGLTTSGSSSSLPPAWVTVKNSGANPSTCSASRSRKLSGMSSGKYAFWCPVALIRPSRSACRSSQIRYPYGLMTMLPRTGHRSTRSARKTTSLYQAAKSSLCGVTLRSSRATIVRLPSSDWDFGLDYRERLDPADVQALGWPGRVFAPGEWGRIVNGGAWLTIDGTKVDLIYRDIDEVLRWSASAEQG